MRASLTHVLPSPAWLKSLAQPAAKPSVSGRFTYIDALRGLAACYVLVYHFVGRSTNDFTAVALPQPLHFIVTHGWLGVEVFFVLSGFVISYSLRAAQVTPGYVGRFALRRSLRLDPPYWITILLTYLGLRLLSGPVAIGAGESETGVVLANLAYANYIVGCPAIVGIGWTLCLEVQLYLTFILLLGLTQWLAARRCGDTWARLLVFLPVLVYSLLTACGALAAPWRGLCCAYWYMFFLGVLASWVVQRQVPAWWFFVGLLAVAIAVLFRWNDRENAEKAAAAALTALSIVVVGRLGRLSDFLDRPVLQHLGRISYSVYLVHPVVGWPLIAVGIRSLGSKPSLAEAMLLVLAATVVSFAAAELLHYLVERPTLAWSKRVRL